MAERAKSVADFASETLAVSGGIRVEFVTENATFSVSLHSNGKLT